MHIQEYIGTCVYATATAPTHGRMWRGRRTTAAVTPQVPPTLFFETRSSLPWNLSSRLGWPRSYRALCAGITSMPCPTMSSFSYMGPEDRVTTPAPMLLLLCFCFCIEAEPCHVALASFKVRVILLFQLLGHHVKSVTCSI